MQPLKNDYFFTTTTTKIKQTTETKISRRRTASFSIFNRHMVFISSGAGEVASSCSCLRFNSCLLSSAHPIACIASSPRRTLFSARIFTYSSSQCQKLQPFYTNKKKIDRKNNLIKAKKKFYVGDKKGQSESRTYTMCLTLVEDPSIVRRGTGCQHLHNLATVLTMDERDVGGTSAKRRTSTSRGGHGGDRRQPVHLRKTKQGFSAEDLGLEMEGRG